MNLQLKKILFYGISFLSVRMLIGGISALYILSRGFSLEGLAILKGLQTGIVLLLSLVFSYLSDKYGRNKIIFLSVLSSALWLGASAYATNINWIIIGEIFNAISLSSFNGPFEAYLIDTYKQHNPEGAIAVILGVFSKYSFINGKQLEFTCAELKIISQKED